MGQAGRAALTAAGFFIGMVAATCGIGGGLFAVPLLHYGFKLPLKAAVATSLCLVLATSTSATVTEALHPGRALLPELVGVLVLGALVGAQIGHRIASRLPVKKLKAVFSVVLLLAGARLLLAGAGGGADEALVAFVPTSSDYAVALAIGLVAGVAVPLLGVGGGLVVVPCLLFVMPQLGYLGARAASLGMATLTSARSIFLYRKDGLIDWKRARWFALGALAGAVGGVYWVHQSGNAILARGALGGVLVLAGLRFSVDALRRADR
ncbi:MAG: putative membrane protein YfcA [Chlamydiales bacterium]|jgi:uncharacterized membrane protein YfcA